MTGGVYLQDPDLPKGARIYFVGICGTGMASVAGLCKEAGFVVGGSDVGVYPPMSTMLEELKISVDTPYDAANVRRFGPDLAVIANALSRGHVELEYVCSEEGVPYTSFPALVGSLFLKRQQSIVVAGTHGKTTTTSLIAHVLQEAGLSPSFLIGGVPRNFPQSFGLGGGRHFVIEGDEYDTAFFDKGPKFLHYRPRYLVLNNVEFDHADIYPNVEAIDRQFAALVGKVQDPRRVIANVDDPGVERVLRSLELERRVTRVSTRGNDVEADVCVRGIEVRQGMWEGTICSRSFGDFVVRTDLSGEQNIWNIAQTIGLLGQIGIDGDAALTALQLVEHIKSFRGVARRFDHLGSTRGIDVFEDFAHHPTAVRLVLEGMRREYPGRRLLVAFEPRNATARRNVFQEAFAKSLATADRIFVGACPVDNRIPEGQRMSTEAMVAEIGPKARAFSQNDELLEALLEGVQSGDLVVFMSSGAFSGIQHRFAKAL